MTTFPQIADLVSSHASTDSLNNLGTTFSCTTGQGNRFPVTGNPYFVTVYDESFGAPNLDPNREVIKVTDRSGDDFTVVRGQLGTSAVAHPGTPALAMFIHADHLNAIYAAILALESGGGAPPWHRASGLAVGGETVLPTEAGVVSESESVVVNGLTLMKERGHYTINYATGDVTVSTALEAGDEWEIKYQA